MLNVNMNFFLKDTRDISGISMDTILTSLDLIEIIVREQQVVRNLEWSNYAILKPLHCIIGETANAIIIGLTNTNAVNGLQTLGVLKNTVPSSDSESFMREIMEKEFGGTLDGFLEIEKKYFTIHEKIFNEFKNTEGIKKLDIVNSSNSFLFDTNRIANIYLDKYKEEENVMRFDPIFKARELQIDEKLVFCILPFDDDRLEIFTDIIRKELEDDFNLKVMRADDIFSNEDIMEDIWTYICKAKFVIADVSLKNPNVFYELGICHTVGKEVITICDESSLGNDYNGKLPFDIASRRTIFYKNSGSGPQKMILDLKKHVKTILEKNL